MLFLLEIWKFFFRFALARWAFERRAFDLFYLEIAISEYQIRLHVYKRDLSEQPISYSFNVFGLWINNDTQVERVEISRVISGDIMGVQYKAIPVPVWGIGKKRYSKRGPSVV